MRLRSIHYQNFMGLRDFTLQLDGGSATIRATNAAGKTTLFSGLTFLLTGKDAAGRAEFDIKTLGPDGEPLHNLEHSVEATFEIGDELLTLKRAFVEVWTKRRGSSSSEFTGHETRFWIDGVPCGTKREYEDRVAEIAPPSLFRLLTDPDAFHALHWKEKRALLLDVCGDVQDEDVIAEHPDLEDLPSILGKRSIDEHRKVVDARRKEINRELQTIPVRIDETTQARPDAPSEDRATLTKTLERLRGERSNLEEQRAQASATTAVAEKQAELREVEEARRQVERRVKAKAEESADQAQRDAREAAAKVDEQEAAVKAIERDRLAAAGEIERLEKRITDLRGEWVRVNERAFEHEHDDTCPACGQSLPADQVEAAHAKARERFNAAKSADLTAIQDEGKQLRAKVDKLEADEARLSEQLEAAEDEAQTLREQAAIMRDLAKDRADAIPDPAADPEHQKITARIEQLQSEIDELRAGTRDATTEIDARIAGVDTEISQVQAQLAALEQAERADQRVQELAAREKELAGEFEDLDRQLHLLDSFTRAKAAMLTDRINSHFTITQFRLHEEQINGGLTDTCLATVNGVPYGTGLNRAARINSGLDVIRALQAHHQLYPPVWIDECESVVETLPLDCQVIKLVVDERYPTLNVQLHEAPEEVPA